MTIDELVIIANGTSKALGGKDIAKEAVILVLNGATTADVHREWYNKQQRLGWKYGDVFSPSLKTDPRMAPYYNLVPPETRAWYEGVHAVVYSQRFWVTRDNIVNPVIPQSLMNMTPTQQEDWETENEVTIADLQEVRELEEGNKGVSGELNLTL
jgi:hypothetical protein